MAATGMTPPGLPPWIQHFLDQILTELASTSIPRKDGIATAITEEIGFRLSLITMRDRLNDKVDDCHANCDAWRMANALMATFGSPENSPALTQTTYAKAAQGDATIITMIMASKSVPPSEKAAYITAYMTHERSILRSTYKPFNNKDLTSFLATSQTLRQTLWDHGLTYNPSDPVGQSIRESEDRYSEKLSDNTTRKSILTLPDGDTKKALLPLLQKGDDIRQEALGILATHIADRSFGRTNATHARYVALHAQIQTELRAKETAAAGRSATPPAVDATALSASAASGGIGGGGCDGHATPAGVHHVAITAGKHMRDAETQTGPAYDG